MVGAKYNIYEVLESNREGTKFRIIGFMKDNEFKKKYGDREILLIKNYDDTKTTSVIVLREE